MNEQDTARLQFVQRQIISIRQWLIDNPPGVTEIAREGFSASYNRTQALDELKYYEEEEKKLDGRKKPIVRPIDMRGSWD
jgi:hypothetical protein